MVKRNGHEVNEGDLSQLTVGEILMMQDHQMTEHLPRLYTDKLALEVYKNFNLWIILINYAL